MLRTNSTRRQFLKQSALAGAAVTAGLSLTRSVHAQGSGTIKVGLIGSGGRGSGAVVQALNTGKDVKFVAIGDYFKVRAQNVLNTLKAQYPEQVDVPDENVFDGFENYAGVIASEADVVLIACAAKFHPLYSKKAVEAGKHVFVEKPNAIDAAGIQTLEEAVALARQKNVSYLSGLHSRYCLSGQALVEQIHNGAIGEIRAIQSSFLRAPYGVRGAYNGITELDFQIYNQYMFHWLSGDDFIQSLVHNVDRMLWTLGKVPKAADGMGGRATSIGHQYGNVFDHHSVVFYFGEENCRLFAACRTAAGCYDSYNDDILGTKGVADWNSASIRGETNWKYSGANGYGHQEEQTALFHAIRNGERIDSGDYVINSTMTAILGQMACYTGQMISWDDLYKSKFLVKPAPEDCVAGMDPPVVPGPDGLYPVPVPGTNPWF
ncbi:MAG: Gfo/Idh/MocA family oxidoreductase [Planctomycetaceae bacterium]|nr:Gfo/Idh/MocA family oxidoreductase [Planctomycetaceae bacterium]